MYLVFRSCESVNAADSSEAIGHFEDFDSN